MKLRRLLPACLRGEEEDTTVSYSGRRVEQFRWQEQPVIIDRMPVLPLSPFLRPGRAPCSPSCLLPRQDAKADPIGLTRSGRTTGSEFHTFTSSGEGQGPGFLSVFGAPSALRLVSVDLTSPCPERRGPALPSHYPGTPLPQSCRPAALLGAVAVLPAPSTPGPAAAPPPPRPAPPRPRGGPALAKEPVITITAARNAEQTDTTPDTSSSQQTDMDSCETETESIDSFPVSPSPLGRPEAEELRQDGRIIRLNDEKSPSTQSSKVSPTTPSFFTFLPSPLPWSETKKVKRIWVDQPNV